MPLGRTGATFHRDVKRAALVWSEIKRIERLGVRQLFWRRREQQLCSPRRRIEPLIREHRLVRAAHGGTCAATLCAAYTAHLEQIREGAPKFQEKTQMPGAIAMR